MATIWRALQDYTQRPITRNRLEEGLIQGWRRIMPDQRLLIIDDEEPFRELARTAAERVGFDVVVTSNAGDFKQAYQNYNPTSILLDVVMPGTDGVELIQWLATEGCTAKIIVATGYAPNFGAMTRALGKAKGLASVSTLLKPVSLTDLRHAISREDVE